MSFERGIAMKFLQVFAVAVLGAALCVSGQAPSTNVLSFELADGSVIVAPKVMRVNGNVVTLKHVKGISSVNLSEMSEQVRAALNLPAPAAAPAPGPSASSQPPPAPQLGEPLPVTTPPVVQPQPVARSVCTACRGYGRTTCVACNGAGFSQKPEVKDCKACGGTGRVSEYDRYTYGGGAGQRREERRYYAGSHACADCGGDGKKETGGHVNVYCPACGGHKVQTCLPCNGTGR